MAQRIQPLKQAVICFKEKANEIIAELNRTKTFTLIDQTNGEEGSGSTIGYGEFEDDDQNMTLTLYVSTVDLIACDSEGNQKTYRLLGYELPAE